MTQAEAPSQQVDERGIPVEPWQRQVCLAGFSFRDGQAILDAARMGGVSARELLRFMVRDGGGTDDLG